MNNKEVENSVLNTNNLSLLTIDKINILNKNYYGYISPSGEFYPLINQGIEYADQLLTQILKDEKLREAYFLCRKEALIINNSHLLSLIIDYYLVGHLKYYKFDIDNLESNYKLKSVTDEQQAIIDKLLSIYNNSQNNSRSNYSNSYLFVGPLQLVKN